MTDNIRKLCINVQSLIFKTLSYALVDAGLFESREGKVESASK